MENNGFFNIAVNTKLNVKSNQITLLEFDGIFDQEFSGAPT